MGDGNRDGKLDYQDIKAMIFQSRESREAALQGRLRSKFKVQEVVVHKKSTLDVRLHGVTPNHTSSDEDIQ